PIYLSRKLIVRGGTVVFVLLTLFLFRVKILRAMGHFLIVEDPVEQVDAIFVLSGNSFDRGEEAARLYREGFGKPVICLGGETNPALELFEIDVKTAEMTKRVLLGAGVASEDVELLPHGTSTFEEFEAIRDLCQARKYTKIMIVSSLFHTRRINDFFRLRLHFEGIQMVLRGASERSFDEENWWQKEPGLIFLNNEYIKMVYYWMKY
ncbi:MAG: YdcF family protein, partial [Bacteroidota bacterium]